MKYNKIWLFEKQEKRKEYKDLGQNSAKKMVDLCTYTCNDIR